MSDLALHYTHHGQRQPGQVLRDLGPLVYTTLQIDVGTPPASEAQKPGTLRVGVPKCGYMLIDTGSPYTAIRSKVWEQLLDNSPPPPVQIKTAPVLVPGQTKAERFPLYTIFLSFDHEGGAPAGPLEIPRWPTAVRSHLPAIAVERKVGDKRERVELVGVVGRDLLYNGDLEYRGRAAKVAFNLISTFRNP